VGEFLCPPCLAVNPKGLVLFPFQLLYALDLQALTNTGESQSSMFVVRLANNEMRALLNFEPRTTTSELCIYNSTSMNNNVPHLA